VLRTRSVRAPDRGSESRSHVGSSPCLGTSQKLRGERSCCGSQTSQTRAPSLNSVTQLGHSRTARGRPRPRVLSVARDCEVEESVRRNRSASGRRATFTSLPPIHDDINPRRRVRGPGLQGLVSRVPSRGGTSDAMYSPHAEYGRSSSHEHKRIALPARLTLKFRRISRQFIERALCRPNK
jgi:hypothetical protein